MKRRQFLVLTGASIGGTIVYSLDRHVSLLSAQEKPKTIRIPLRFLTESEALILAAAVARIFPKRRIGSRSQGSGCDDIHRPALAGPWGRDAHRYTHGPFDENAAPEFGYQGRATPRELYRAGLKDLAGLDRLPARRARQGTRADREDPVFRVAAQEHDRRHVQRSDPWRQCGYDWLALLGISGTADELCQRYRQALWRGVSPQADEPERNIAGQQTPPSLRMKIMKSLPSVDVVIVGGGWTGLLMAKELGARTSLSVVVLERGERARTMVEWAEGMDELDYFSRTRAQQDCSQETVTIRHARGRQRPPDSPACEFPSGHRYWRQRRALGAPTRGFSTTSSRCIRRPLRDMGPRSFRRVTRFRIGALRGRRSSLITRGWKSWWAFAARREISGKIIEGGDPFEGPRSTEYPMPPGKVAYICSLFRKAAKELGYHPFPNASAINTVTFTNSEGIVRPACFYCGFCGLFGCMVGAKAHPSTLLLPSIRKQKSVSIRTGGVSAASFATFCEWRHHAESARALPTWTRAARRFSTRRVGIFAPGLSTTRVCCFFPD